MKKTFLLIAINFVILSAAIGCFIALQNFRNVVDGKVIISAVFLVAAMLMIPLTFLIKREKTKAADD